MELTMWMIANRLRVLDPELHLKDSEKREIKGIRFYAADKYAMVTERGNDIICKYEEEYFVLPDIDRDVAFGLILDVFDFYNNWEVQARQLAGRMNFQKLVDSCYPIFYNPVLLLDVNYKVMAMSRQFGQDDVDAEWKYLFNNNFSSVQAVHVLRDKKRQSVLNQYETETHIWNQRLDEAGCMNYSCNLLFERNVCGHLVIMEKERAVNKGDDTMMRILAELLAPYVGKMNFNNQYTWGNSVFSRLLSGEAVEEDALMMQMQYYEWKKTDVYQVLVFSYRESEGDDALYRLLRSSLIQSAPFCVVEIHGREIVFLVNHTRQDFSRISDRIQNILYRNAVNCYASQSAAGIDNICCLYHQAGKVKKYAVRENPKYCYNFEEIAVGYILREGERRKKVLASYGPFLALWQSGSPKDQEALNTIRCYLVNNQSPSETARQLFVAKNTLNYRIKKLEEKLELELQNPDKCLYYLISLELLRALGREG